MKLKKLLPLILTVAPFMAGAQHIKSGYVNWGITGTEFPTALENWEKGQKWTDDDNFFISRVKPKIRFRNTATQVNPSLDETNDKKLIFWVPINSPEFNALPDGVFDREVFPMWSYITHYGNWSTPLVRMPGNFIDVAHKNGVPVSVVASIPWGNIIDSWKNSMKKLITIQPEKLADYLEFYGIDGLGYNSEFASEAEIPLGLASLHAKLIKLLKPTGRMPLAENIWYDGTNEYGGITFDNGLGTHNDDLWGYGDSIKTHLFMNYNWNSFKLVDSSIEHAKTLERTPLDLYCGINMQGREPKTGVIWPLLASRPLSIGLWGAHSENMFFESRAEKGTEPETQQRSYMLRMERWFTGGTRNPINTPKINNSLNMEVDNYTFFGMSKLMSARSALKWNLSDEPFITYFNLGNGKFFNYGGKRQNSNEWYNIGVQDYLPTWMWWFSDKFLGRNPEDAPTAGLDAEFVWDDAWVGGSLVRIHGTSSSEYLHLFKTEFEIKRGDIITVRYKVINGNCDASLALSVKGNEATPIDESKLRIMDKADTHNEIWRTVTFNIDDELSGLEDKELAMIAIHFKNAENLDMRLGQFSIVRGNETAMVPDPPVIDRAELMASNHRGADGKIIFHMPNNKGNNVCYNIDVHTSLFKLYARQSGKEPVFMGLTPSWAGLIFSAPIDFTTPDAKIAFGVSGLSLDMSTESKIVWSDEFDINSIYEFNDEIEINRSVITPGDPFTISYIDPLHENGKWELKDSEGNIVATATDRQSLEMTNGLTKPGNYTLTLTGMVQNGETREEQQRTFEGYVQIADNSCGRLPEITSLTANGSTDAITIDPGTTVEMEYTASDADGILSRGVKVKDAGIGFAYSETGYEVNKPFSVSFWFKPDDFKNKAVHMLNIRDKGDVWANNNWGWFWHTLKEDGSFDAFTIRTPTGTIEYDFGDFKFTPGIWQHVTYVFDFDSKKAVRPFLYVDGKEVPLKSYTRGTATYTGESIKYEPRTYGWRQNNVVALGGYLHKSGSIRANVDNFMFWTKALDAEGAKIAMGDIDTKNLPEGLEGYFDFESQPDEKGSFTNEGHGTFKAGIHDYQGTEIEGQGIISWKQPVYCAGSPFISGKTWEIKTSPKWTVPGGKIISVQGDGKSGKATLQFPIDGKFDVELNLNNEYGYSRKTIPVIVGSAAGVDEIITQDELGVSPNPFHNELKVKVNEPGNYEFILHDMNGKMVFNRPSTLNAGESISLFPNVESGMYVLSVIKNDKKVFTHKVIKR